MKKILVIGCPGSGKTTFSRRLAERLALPLFHLDAIWHKADRTHITREEFDARLGEILARDTFLIDGNYSRTLPRRLAACDTVFLFDLPVEVCLAGVTARLGSLRPDIPFVDTVPDPRLLAEVEAFPEKDLPAIYALLAALEGKKIFIFKSRAEADAYLLGLS